MLTGLFAGFIAAFMQSMSYIFSRWFVVKHGSPWLLVVYSQIAMGIAGLISIPFILPWTSIPWNGKFFLYLLIWLIFSPMGQFGFFRTLHELEASRLSSLIGLKIILLALISVVFLRQPLHFLQWVAIAFSVCAAVGMNLTGGPLRPRGIFWLFFTLTSYSCSDICATQLVKMMIGDSMLINSIGIIAYFYGLQGVCTLPFLFWIPRGYRLFRDSIPFALLWYGAMIFLILCFGTVGVVFGNIIQSTRGLISILLGLCLLRMGYDSLEPRVGRSAWIRRIIMAVFMLGAIALYSIVGAH